MLTKLTIDNLALIESAELNFEPGLSVLTGETGAGKSVIITALSLALGDRAEKEFIRHGSDRADIVATFDLASKERSGNSKSLALSRSVARNGSGSVAVDGRKVSLTRLRDVTRPLAEVLGQHANQMLMDEDNHLLYLDRFGKLLSKREGLSAIYAEWKSATEKLQHLVSRRQHLIAERELLLFQRNEIEKAAVRSGEEEALSKERKLLDSARSLMESSNQLADLLDGEENSVLQLLSLARRELDKMATIDPELETKTKELDEAGFLIEELCRSVEQYGASVVDNPSRIEQINLRLDEIYNLKKKYGGSEEAILSTLSTINEKLGDREDVDSMIEQLETTTARLFDEYSKAALTLSMKRKSAAAKIEKLVTKELSELAIDGAGFEFEFTSEDDPDGVVINGRAVKPFAHGLESGRILFSANPGEPLKSLVKTASGGEISRVLLALKSAEMANGSMKPSLLVFDEVDAGIGGRTAVEVAKKLKKLSKTSQLLVVTHLHQIAREADHHFVAVKRTDRSKRTVIDVRELCSSDVRAELDRMVALPDEVS